MKVTRIFEINNIEILFTTTLLGTNHDSRLKPIGFIHEFDQLFNNVVLLMQRTLL